MPSTLLKQRRSGSRAGRRFRLPTLLFSVLVAVPVAVALPVTTPPGASPHPVAPKVETWNATDALRIAVRQPRTPHAYVPGVEHHASKFSLVGVRYTSGGLPAGAQIQLRTRNGSGTWSGWTTTETDDTAADAGSMDAVAAKAVDGSAIESDPIFSGDADSVQTRVVSAEGNAVAPPASLEVITINPGTSAADSGAKVPSSVAQAAAPTPVIHTRAEWGADESLRARNPGCGTPAYSDTIQAAIVHHTAGGNDYSAADVPSIIRGVYAYHVIGRGYCDIAYNFLVDRFGQIWEGRYGGVTKAVLGAHSGGFNTNTTGVAVLGTYDSVPASTPSIDALQRLLGWKLAAWQANPLGTTVLVSRGGDSTALPAGAPIRVNVVSGHRDVDQTGCPGNRLYAQLPAIRAGAFNWVGEGMYDLAIGWAPGSGGLPVTLGANSIHPATWKVTISSTGGTTLRPFTGTVGAGARFNVGWDGRTSGGSSVGPGVYLATFEAATGADPAVPRTIPFGVTYGSGDLAVITTPDASGGQVSVKVATQSSKYQSVVVDKSTTLHVANPADWSFVLQSYNGDFQPDLYAIQSRNTGSGHVEVHVLSAADDYQSYLAHFATALPAVNPSQWQMQLAPTGGYGTPDLYGIQTNGGASGHIEVHVLSAASGYTTFSLHAATALGAASNTLWSVFPNAAGDITAVLRARTGSGFVEVHTMTAATFYQAFSVHAVTPVLADTGGVYQFSTGDADHDGIPDVFLAKLDDTATSGLELHALSGASGYHAFDLHSATAVSRLDPAAARVSAYGG